MTDTHTPAPFTDIRRIPVGEHTFDVAVAGPEDGEPVLLLHGFPESYDEWRAVAPLLTAAGLRVIAPDQRGYSPGARPSSVEDYRIDRLVADALGILDRLGAGRAHVVGHDWGASVAWTLAARHPGRVATLIAVSVPHLAAFRSALKNDPDQRRKSQYMQVFREEGRAEEALLADDARRFRDVFGDAVPRDLIDAHLRRLGTPEGIVAALNWYRAMTPEMSQLPPVDVPTTYVWGTDDVALGRTGAEACGEYVTADYLFVPLEGIGHWIPEEAPARLATEILARARQ
ncbi:alpha/beta fold hydrolase [Tomitella fengzijianii]|uniref:Alpha/beta hydrolase n=1 Tax=Tomitella fengzijianii TaxID=2597660 RepID=A0A516WZC3_9ACTN|nr:alpha/beta hydrolase [Tomitella fengzijianii]QDQ96182.1 alpha/beta hydrolase [Tomitella fengzijianii]